MNIEYRKIFNKNYAIISDYNISNYKECYRSKMLKNNRLEHFLVYDTQNINGTVRFTYDISSKQSIYSFYENCDIDYETIRHFIMSLKDAVDTLNNYLLEPDYIVLDPHLIYMNIATKSLYFCYCPGENNNFYDSVNEFLCYILSKINHDDNNAIILAYSLQQQSINKNYTLDDLMEIINKSIFHQSENILPSAEYKTEVPQPSPIPSDVQEFHSTANIFDEIDFTGSSSDKISLFTSRFNEKNTFFFNVIGIALLCAAIIIFAAYKQWISKELCGIFLLTAICLCYITYRKSKKKDSPSEIVLAPDFTQPHTSDVPEQKDSIYYEDTVIIGYRNAGNSPRLVYTGTDFVSDTSLTHFPFIIGKMTENVDMTIDNPMISRIHAKIYLKENLYYIEDMNSSNGTYINNTMLQPHTLTEIKEGDFVTFSHLTYLFQ
jgi:hypothetical protein